MKPAFKLGILTLTAAFVFGMWLYSAHSVGAASSGKVSGMVKLEGEAPKQKVIDMSKEPNCVKIHENNPGKTEAVVVGPNGGLKNVVIYVSEGLNPADAQTPSQPAEINQQGCQYHPHVVALDVNQKLKVINSDQNSHNIHPLPKQNREWNKSQPPGAPPFEESFDTPEMIPVKCNVHPWMRSYLAVVKGPYAVSSDDGSFSLNLSPGTYTLTAWQETYGTQTQKVTVAAGKPATVDFTFKAK